MEDPQEDPLAMHCFCMCSGSALLHDLGGKQIHGTWSSVCPIKLSYLVEYHANLMVVVGHGMWTGAHLASWALKSAGFSCSTTTAGSWFQSLTVLAADLGQVSFCVVSSVTCWRSGRVPDLQVWIPAAPLSSAILGKLLKHTHMCLCHQAV